MTLESRIAQLEKTHAPTPEKAHIAFLPKDIHSAAYQSVSADIAARRAAGQKVIVFTVRNARITQPMA
jgi:hypothetical protein